MTVYIGGFFSGCAALALGAMLYDIVTTMIRSTQRRESLSNSEVLNPVSERALDKHRP